LVALSPPIRALDCHAWNSTLNGCLTCTADASQTLVLI
jgi:hypothetical protein